MTSESWSPMVSDIGKIRSCNACLRPRTLAKRSPPRRARPRRAPACSRRPGRPSDPLRPRRRFGLWRTRLEVPQCGRADLGCRRGRSPRQRACAMRSSLLAVTPTVPRNTVCGCRSLDGLSRRPLRTARENQLARSIIRFNDASTPSSAMGRSSAPVAICETDVDAARLSRFLGIERPNDGLGAVYRLKQRGGMRPSHRRRGQPARPPRWPGPRLHGTRVVRHANAQPGVSRVR